MLTLEICQRLKDAGFRQDTELAWFNTILGFPRNTEYVSYIQKMNIGMPSVCACPTTDEIWAELTAKQISKLIFRWSIEEEPSDSIETDLAEYWLEVNNG